MWRTRDGSTGRLLQLCAGYFGFYVITGLSVKYFQSTRVGFPGMNGMEYLIYSTASSTLLATFVAVALGWFRMDSVRRIHILGLSIPSELLYIIPSGVCTAVVIPTTTLLYSFQTISVMVAMVLMRGAVIIIGRAVDAIQIRQGILQKKVFAEENWAVLFALLAVSVKILNGGEPGKANPFTSLAVVSIFTSYILAYSLRIYIMNYYKNTRPSGPRRDNNKGFFTAEQLSSTLTIWITALVLIWLSRRLNWTNVIFDQLNRSVVQPHQSWMWAMVFGASFGVVAFFSVFIFMFKGRTATFAGLVNRLTSLIAGTTSTLLFALLFGGRFPELIDWISLIFILIAVAFLTIAEKKRARELALQTT